MGYIQIDELKSKLPEGIWLLTGGNIKLQRFLKASNSEEKLQKDLKNIRSVMKLKINGDTIQVTTIHTDGTADARALNIDSVAAEIQDDGTLLLLMEKTPPLDFDSVQESVQKAIATGAITHEEYEKYKNTEVWETLPKIEFTMVSKLT